MIDIHCHLLPGIDDGATNLVASMDMARASVQSGITHALCTPHIHYGYFDNNIDIIRSTHEIFASALERENIPLRTHYAAEIRITPEITKLYAKGTIPFIGYLDGKPVLLLELPHSHIPIGLEQFLGWLKSRGIKPIIAHPERNRDILSNFNKAIWLKGLGVMFQVTAGAITGTFGSRVQSCSIKMLEEGLVDVVATDAHNLQKRPPEMGGAFSIIQDEFDFELANDLCKFNPWRMVSCWFEGE